MHFASKYTIGRRVARIWKRGGAILKEWEKCKRPWPEFSLWLNQNHTVCPKIETNFLGKLGNSKLFSAQNQVVSEKKKGLRRNWVWFFGRIPKFKAFFRPKSGGLQKKGLRQNSDWFFGQIRKFKRLRGAVFLWWGLFSIFHTKSASKAPKTCDFAYFTSQWGGARAPPSPPWLRYWPEAWFLLSENKDSTRLTWQHTISWVAPIILLLLNS